MTNKFSDVYTAFFKKIEKDRRFFNYFNLTPEEAMSLAKERAKNYLIEAIVILGLNCTTDVNFNDFDIEAEVFNFNLTDMEVDILARLMFEVHIEKDISLLKVHSSFLSPADMAVLHSPAQERKTFLEMFEELKKYNRKLISKYAARDRLTGKRKTINHSLYMSE